MDNTLPRARRKSTRSGEQAPPPPPPPPSSMRMPDDMTPTPEQEDRMRRQVQDEREMQAMERAYKEAPRRSMQLGFAKGGAVGSASKRADGCAQRGKTRGRII